MHYIMILIYGDLSFVFMNYAFLFESRTLLNYLLKKSFISFISSFSKIF